MSAQTGEPTVAYVHPNRGPGIWYAALAGLVAAIALGGVGSNLADGSVAPAAVIFVAGGGLAAFLGYLAAVLLGPALHVGPDGVRGRVAYRRPVDLPWDAVEIGVDEEGPRGRLRLDLGVASFEVQARSWVGFTDLVLVLATTPAALERMSGPAIEELVRLLDVEGPTSTADLPDL